MSNSWYVVLNAVYILKNTFYITDIVEILQENPSLDIEIAKSITDFSQTISLGNYLI